MLGQRGTELMTVKFDGKNFQNLSICICSKRH